MTIENQENARHAKDARSWPAVCAGSYSGANDNEAGFTHAALTRFLGEDWEQFVFERAAARELAGDPDDWL